MAAAIFGVAGILRTVVTRTGKKATFQHVLWASSSFLWLGLYTKSLCPERFMKRAFIYPRRTPASFRINLPLYKSFYCGFCFSFTHHPICISDVRYGSWLALGREVHSQEKNRNQRELVWMYSLTTTTSLAYTAAFPHSQWANWEMKE